MLGIDIVNNKHFEHAAAKYDRYFLNKIFCDDEITGSKEPTPRLLRGWMQQFAIKEAVIKALGVPADITMRDIVITAQTGTGGETFTCTIAKYDAQLSVSATRGKKYTVGFALRIE